MDETIMAKKFSNAENDEKKRRLFTLFPFLRAIRWNRRWPSTVISS